MSRRDHRTTSANNGTMTPCEYCRSLVHRSAMWETVDQCDATGAAKSVAATATARCTSRESLGCEGKSLPDSRGMRLEGSIAFLTHTRGWTVYEAKQFQ